MFGKILDCPKCLKRFHYECAGPIPPRIVCPECHAESPMEEYSAVILCSECRAKLKLPLDMLDTPGVVCPRCGVTLVGERLDPHDEEETTIALENTLTAKAEQQLLADGELFDKYRIVRLLGRGGMAEVYLADHLLLQRPCALKLMRRGLADEAIFIKRFVREAKLANRIEHPNIVRVYDAGSDFKTGLLFLAMEYVEGQTLLEMMRGRRLSEAELREILVAMAGALKALAELHVIHRDIKPSNIMRTKDGIYKLMDLGIAKSESDRGLGEMTLTVGQAAIGTPSYASPEQCRSAHDVDIRSDIYCLGATLYHLASGRVPFDGETPVAVILKVMQSEAVPLRKLRPDLSRQLVELIERMMKKNPDDRPSSPDELLALAAAPVRSRFGDFIWSCRRFVTELLRPSWWKPRKIAAGAALLAAAVLLTVIAVPAAFSRGGKKAAEPPAPVAEKTAVAPAPVAPVPVAPAPVAPAPVAPVPVAPAPAAPKELKKLESDQSFIRELESRGVVVGATLGRLSKPAAADLLLSCEFFRPPPGMILAGGRCRGSLLHLDGAGPGMPKIPLTAGSGLGEFSCTIYAAPAPERGTMGLLSIGDSLELQLRDRRIGCLIGDCHAEFATEIPDDGWFRLTAAVDGGRRRVLLVLNDRILGVLRIPDGVEVRLGDVVLGSRRSDAAWKGRIDFLSICRGAIDFLPLRIRSSADWEFAKKRLHVSLAEPRDLETRLRACRERLTAVRAEAPSQLRDDMIAFIERQIAALEEQRNLMQLARAKRAACSPEETRKARALLEGLLSAERSPLFSGLARHPEMRRLLDDPRVDLVATIRNPFYGQQNLTFIKTDMREISMLEAIFLRNDTALVDLVRTRKLDANRLAVIPPDLFSFGIDDVDGPGLITRRRLASPDLRRSDPRYKNQREKFPMHFSDRQINILSRVVGAYHPILWSRCLSGEFCDFLQLAPDLDPVRDRFGRNLMHDAAGSDASQAVRALVLAGFTAGREPDDQGVTPWQFAVRNANENAMAELKRLGLTTPLRPEDQARYEFCRSVKHNDAKRVEELLRQGADPYLPFANGFNAMQQACVLGHRETVEAMLRLRVDPGRCAERPSAGPLVLAVVTENPEMLSLLLRNGVKLPPSEFRSRCGLAGLMLRQLTPRNVKSTIAMLEVLMRDDPEWNVNQRLPGKNSGESLSLAEFIDFVYQDRPEVQEVAQFLERHGVRRAGGGNPPNSAGGRRKPPADRRSRPPAAQ